MQLIALAIPFFALVLFVVFMLTIGNGWLNVCVDSFTHPYAWNVVKQSGHENYGYTIPHFGIGQAGFKTEQEAEAAMNQAWRTHYWPPKPQPKPTRKEKLKSSGWEFQ